MITPFIISISGESGVGKSTISDIVALFYGVENTVVISTDDLHKWERSNSQWNLITHLHPNANNLEMGDQHLQELAAGRPIYRSIYNHRTGHFNPPVKIEPKPVIIHEGLHAFYSDLTKNISHLKIFVDMEEQLTSHFKIIRDTEERGYKYNVVLDTIHKRKHDGKLLRDAQIESADVVISIQPRKKIQCLGDKNEVVELTISFSNNGTADEKLLTFIEQYFIGYNRYCNLSHLIGNDVSLCQDSGGNLSVKITDELMLVKPSGFKIKETKSVSKINHTRLLHSQIDNDHQLLQVLAHSLVGDSRPASMETGLHAFLPQRYVLHTHPVYLTLLLCLTNSCEIIASLFGNLDYHYVGYTNPAFCLYDAIRQLEVKGIYFLENHGLIVADDDYDAVVRLLQHITKSAQSFVGRTFDVSAPTSLTDGYAFPDALIFTGNADKMETRAAHYFIHQIGKQLGTLRYLSQDNILALQGMEAEKYRQAQ